MRFLDQDSNISKESYELLTKYQEVVSSGLGILGIKPKLKMWKKGNFLFFLLSYSYYL